MVVGIVALLAIFWLPFKHPKACAVAVLYAMLLGAFMWLIGSTDTLENSSSVMWIPTFAGAVWIYRRYMAPKPPKK